MSSKLKISFLILFGLLFSACGNTSRCSSVPSEPVFIELNLLIEGHRHLNNQAFQNIYFTERNRSIGVEHVGYGGVLITTFLGSSGVQYAAFDMTCPYEMDRNVRVFPISGFAAECSSCGSRFDLSNGLGMLTQGPAREHLRPLNIRRVYAHSVPYLIVTQRHCR